MISNGINNYNLRVHLLKCNTKLNNKCDLKWIQFNNVKELTYLGLIVDNRLINNILRKFSYVLKKIKYLFNDSYKIIIRFSFVYSIVFYNKFICARNLVIF
jgi:hypothetical protein